MVFTVYGICTARGLYVLLRAEPEEVHTARGWYYSTVKTVRQLTCTDRPYKANRLISLGARMSSTLAVYSVKYRTLGAVAILV